MSRSERLLALIQALRRHRRPVSGAALARELSVSLRTIYRDIQTLVGSGAPIDGEAGIGFVLRPGYTLPPLMFTDEEVEDALRTAVEAKTERTAISVLIGLYGVEIPVASAVLTLAAPGAAGSLSANKNIVVDGVAPNVAAVTSTAASDSTSAFVRRRRNGPMTRASAGAAAGSKFFSMGSA